MHKLSIYLNNDQYEKLEILCADSPFQNTEEYANEIFYDWLLYKWLRRRSSQLEKYMRSPEFLNDTEEDTVSHIRDGIYCDGEQAIIGDNALQRINGKLHYLIISPAGADRVPCNDIAAEQYERILKEHDAVLEDLPEESLSERELYYIKED